MGIGQGVPARSGQYKLNARMNILPFYDPRRDVGRVRFLRGAPHAWSEVAWATWLGVLLYMNCFVWCKKFVVYVLFSA